VLDPDVVTLLLAELERVDVKLVVCECVTLADSVVLTEVVAVDETVDVAVVVCDVILHWRNDSSK
jgi:hypothetical protein